MLNCKIYFAVAIFYLVVLNACASIGDKSKMAPAIPANNSVSTTSPVKQSWETDWETLQANARKEGKINIFLAAGGANVRNAFVEELKKFGLAADIFVGTGSEHVNKFTAERRAGIYNADVYVGGGTTILINLIPAGILDPLEPQLLLPDLKDGKTWRPGEVPWIDKNKMVIAFAASATGGVVINTSLVKQDEIISFLDLLNPKWKENMIMNDPTVTGTGLAWFSTTSKLMGLDYMKKLAAQKPMISRDQRLQVDWLAKGKYPVGIGIINQTVSEFIESGAPLKQYAFKEGSYISAGAGCVAFINRAPHPNTARFFINWLLSREGQNVWSKDTGDLSQRLDASIQYVPGHKIPTPGMQYLLEYTEEAQLEKPRYMEIAKEILASVK